MYHRFIALLCCLLFATAPVYADETTALAASTVTNGAKKVSFLHPANCYIFDDGSLGVFVYLDASAYVAVSIPSRGMSGTEKLRENIGDDAQIRMLSDDIYVFATHGDPNHRRFNVDIVSVGLNLSDGTGIIANADCPYGQTEIYDVLLCIVRSLMDATAFEAWLYDEWIPFVCAQ